MLVDLGFTYEGTEFKPDSLITYGDFEKLMQFFGKYVSEAVSKKYSGAEDYFAVASEAVIEMQRQVGENVFDEDGIMQKGIIIRHLVLPGNVSQAMRMLDWVKENLPAPECASLRWRHTVALPRSCQVCWFLTEIENKEPFPCC